MRCRVYIGAKHSVITAKHVLLVPHLHRNRARFSMRVDCVASSGRLAGVCALAAATACRDDYMLMPETRTTPRSVHKNRNNKHTHTKNASTLKSGCTSALRLFRDEVAASDFIAAVRTDHSSVTLAERPSGCSGLIGWVRVSVRVAGPASFFFVRVCVCVCVFWWVRSGACAQARDLFRTN